MLFQLWGANKYVKSGHLERRCGFAHALSHSFATDASGSAVRTMPPKRKYEEAIGSAPIKHRVVVSIDLGARAIPCFFFYASIFLRRLF